MEPDDGAVSVDSVTRRLLTDLLGRPGVQRAGLALTEGGGRRLRFTSVTAHPRSDAGIATASGTALMAHCDTTHDTAHDTAHDTGSGPTPEAGGESRGGVAEQVVAARPEVTWCHVDAYEDVPLTLVVRTGERVGGTMAEIRALFPAYVDNLAQYDTEALLAVPLTAHQQVLGGVIVLCGSADAAESLREEMIALAAQAGEELRRAQLGAPREGGGRLADEAVPEGAVAHDIVVEGDPRAVGRARRFLRTALAQSGLDDDLTDTAVLCLSEIVTNAVIHTRADAELRVLVEGGLVTVTVRDQGVDRGPRPDRLDDHDPLRVHGRGLQLVDALSARWGSDLDTVGTTVWFVLETS